MFASDMAVEPYLLTMLSAFFEIKGSPGRATLRFHTNIARQSCANWEY